MAEYQLYEKCGHPLGSLFSLSPCQKTWNCIDINVNTQGYCFLLERESSWGSTWHFCTNGFETIQFWKGGPFLSFPGWSPGSPGIVSGMWIATSASPSYILQKWLDSQLKVSKEKQGTGWHAGSEAVSLHQEAAASLLLRLRGDSSGVIP